LQIILSERVLKKLKKFKSNKPLIDNFNNFLDGLKSSTDHITGPIAQMVPYWVELYIYKNVLDYIK